MSWASEARERLSVVQSKAELKLRVSTDAATGASQHGLLAALP